MPRGGVNAEYYKDRGNGVVDFYGSKEFTRLHRDTSRDKSELTNREEIITLRSNSVPRRSLNQQV